MTRFKTFGDLGLRLNAGHAQLAYLSAVVCCDHQFSYTAASPTRTSYELRSWGHTHTLEGSDARTFYKKSQKKVLVLYSMKKAKKNVCHIFSHQNDLT